MCIAITSVVVAGGAVVGVGGAASAAVSEHVQRPAVGVAAGNHRSDGGDARNWDRSDDRRSGRDHDYCRDSDHEYRSDRDHGYRQDQGINSSWGDRGGDRDGGSHYNHDRQGSGR
jgi:hypothetical protein